MNEEQLLNNLNRASKYIGSKRDYKEDTKSENKKQNSEVMSSYKRLVKITAIVLGMIVVSHGSYFFAFNASRDVFNRTEKQLSDVTKSITDSMFEDYDCKTVTGRQVQSAYQMLEGKSFSILVKSKLYKDGESVYNTELGINYNELADIGSNIELTGTYYKCEEFKFKSGTYNLNSEDAFKIQNVARSASAFNSRLVKDGTGEVVGISFEQK